MLPSGMKEFSSLLKNYPNSRSSILNLLCETDVDGAILSNFVLCTVLKENEFRKERFDLHRLNETMKELQRFRALSSLVDATRRVSQSLHQIDVPNINQVALSGILRHSVKSAKDKQRCKYDCSIV